MSIFASRQTCRNILQFYVKLSVRIGKHIHTNAVCAIVGLIFTPTKFHATHGNPRRGQKDFDTFFSMNFDTHNS